MYNIHVYARGPQLLVHAFHTWEHTCTHFGLHAHTFHMQSEHILVFMHHVLHMERTCFGSRAHVFRMRSGVNIDLVGRPGEHNMMRMPHLKVWPNTYMYMYMYAQSSCRHF